MWEALSGLFLDTELQPGEDACIARVLARSGYADAELDAILRYEVGPVLTPNLLSVAGEWAGFDVDWLAERIALRPRPAWWRPRFLGAYLVREDWARVRAALAAARAGA